MLTCNIRYLNKLVDIVVSVLTFRADKIVSIGWTLIADGLYLDEVLRVRHLRKIDIDENIADL